MSSKGTYAYCATVYRKALMPVLTQHTHILQDNLWVTLTRICNISFLDYMSAGDLIICLAHKSSNFLRNWKFHSFCRAQVSHGGIMSFLLVVLGNTLTSCVSPRVFPTPLIKPHCPWRCVFSFASDPLLFYQFWGEQRVELFVTICASKHKGPYLAY